MTAESGAPGHFQSDSHALYCGWVMGALMRAGINVAPIPDEEGNYTAGITIAVPSGAGDHDHLFINLIVPPPPEDWRPQ